MKSATIALAAMCAVSLMGCSADPADKLADRVENAGEKRADVIETNAETLRQQAEALEDRAEAVRENADSRADAIEAADMKVGEMSQAQRDAIVANQAPAVR